MKVFELVGEIAIDDRKAKGQIKSVEDQAEKSSSKMQKAFRKVGDTMKRGLKLGAAAGATAVAGMTASSIREFTKFDEKMREVYTLIPDASEEMKRELSQDVRDVGEQYGFLADDTVPALYQALSAGVPPDNVMSFMDQAAQAAKAGVTDLQTSVDGLTSAVNAYGQDVLDAEKASDILFTTVKEGKTTFPELAKNMSNVTPIAASLGVEFEGINAALATMTAQGMDTGKATIYLRAMLNQLSKSGSDANDVFKEMAGQTFQEYIESGNSLADALELMEEYADQNNTTIKKLFSNIRAGTGALQLTGANMDDFNENMDEMESSAGSTEQAYGEMSNSLQQTLDELRAWWQNQRIAIGEDLEEDFRSLLEWLQNHEDDISTAIDNSFARLREVFQWIVNNKSVVVGAISAIGAAATGAGIASLISMLSNPVLLTILGLGAAGGATGYALSKVGESSEGASAKVKALNTALERTQRELERVKAISETSGRDMRDQIATLEDRMAKIRQQLRKAKGETEEASNDTLPMLDRTVTGLDNSLKGLSGSTQLYNDDLSVSQVRTEEQRRKLEELTDTTSDWRMTIDRSRESVVGIDNVNQDRIKRIMAINKVRKKISKRLDVISRKEKYLGNQYDVQQQKVNLYTNALNMLRESGVEPTSEAVQRYQEKIAELTEETGDNISASEKASKIWQQAQQQMAENQAKADVLTGEYGFMENKVSILEDALIQLKAAGLENTETFEKVRQKLKEARGEVDQNISTWEKFQNSMEGKWEGIANKAISELDKILNEGKSVAEGLGDFFSSAGETIAGAIGFALGGRTGAKIGQGLWNIGEALWKWMFGPSRRQKQINKIAENLESSVQSSLKSAFSADTYKDFQENFAQSMEEMMKNALVKSFVTTSAMKDRIQNLSQFIAEAAADRRITSAEESAIQSRYQAIMQRAKPVFQTFKDLSFTGNQESPFDRYVRNLPTPVGSSLRNLREATQQFTAGGSVGGRAITGGEKSVLEQYKSQLGEQSGININMEDVTIRDEEDIEQLAERIFELYEENKQAQGALA